MNKEPFWPQEELPKGYKVTRMEHYDKCYMWVENEGSDVKELIVSIGATPAIALKRALEQICPIVEQVKLSCGCVSCVCEDDIRCHGCGARSCGSGPHWRE